MWRLWEAGRLYSTDMDAVSIDWVADAFEVLDVIDASRPKDKG